MGKLSKAIAVLAVGIIGITGSALPANAANYTKNDIDNKNRAAVSKAYMGSYAKALTIKPGWTGKVTGCKAGVVSSSHIASSASVINFYRGLNGLEKVGTTAAYNAEAQAAALIMQANGALTHYPTKSWKCYTVKGLNGAQTGNLHGGWGGYRLSNSAMAVESYMDDKGAYNTAVGHRRWLLQPETAKMGIGTTTSYNAIKVFNTADYTRYANPTYVAFPNANFSPAQLEPNGRWSLTRNNANFSKATVRVYDYGTKKWATPKKHRTEDGYGNNTLVFEVANAGKNVQALVGTSKTRQYKVEVKNIKVGTKTYSHTYYTKFFDGRKAK